MSRRAAIALGVLALWVVGLGALVRREHFRPASDRLAMAGLRVNPGASYFRVEHEGRHVGWASSSVDTTERAIVITDEMVTQRGADDERLHARATVRLSRALAPQDFLLRVSGPTFPLTVTGRVRSDSALELRVSGGGDDGPPQTVPTRGRAYPPTAVPLLVALGEQRRMGGRVALTLFDPSVMTARDVVLRVVAESLFTVSDSAGFDAATARFTSANRDTVRAWRVEAEDGASPLVGWVDAEGRLVEATYPGGYVLRRTSYEEATENWRRDRADDGADTRPAVRPASR